MTTVRIDGMKCQHCVKTAKKALEDLGATAVEIDLGKCEASYQGSLDKEAVRKAVSDKGFTLVD
ncbi:MAG: heavy metal-associated domain-containing protein [Desulfobulbus sp.]|nr:heavy metal-associated domain-containing protein [Desulfobulbus sp.]